MPIEGFDYKEFTQVLSAQAVELVPARFEEFQRNYVINTIKNFSNLAAEALYNDDSLGYNAEQAMLITQIIAEWSFHKSVDLIKSGLLPDYWDSVMQKIAFTIFEIAKQAIKQGSSQDQILEIVEHQVKNAYDTALEELKGRGVIDETIYNQAVNQSNIKEMMADISQEEALNSCKSGAQSSDSKILKLASVALLLRQVPQGKVQTILNKFNPEDAQTVIQYMQMPDLEDKVDKSIAIRCLQEIKTNLPEPKYVSADKIISKIKKAYEKKGKDKIESLLIKERPFVNNFVDNIIKGDDFTMSSKVANIIALHLEESV